EAFHDRYLREIDHVAVRRPEVRFHAAQAEHDVRVALARDVFDGVEGLFERDAHAALEENGKLALLPDGLQQLEVLRVARPDLQHDACRASGLRALERRADLVEVAFAENLHRGDLDPVFDRELEDVGEALFAVALKLVRARARFVRAHARGPDASRGD